VITPCAQDAGARILAVSDMLESGATSAGDDVNPGAAFNLTDPDQRAALVNALKKVVLCVCAAFSCSLQCC